MTRASIAGSKILTRPNRAVEGGMAGATRTRIDHLMTAGRPAWADDPTLDLPCQHPDVDPDWWFANGTGAQERTIRGVAVMLCGGCPMRDACQAHGRFLGSAKKEGVHGVWGGELMGPLNRPGKNARKAARKRGAA